MPAGTEVRVTIDRLTCRVRAPSGHPDPRGAGARLASLAREELPDRCAEALAGLPDDDAVYRIRRLDLRLVVDGRAAGTGDIGRRWGALLAGRLAETVAAGRPDTVVWYPSPEAYVTAFVRDLVDGCAWQRWWYDELRPLQRFDAGQAALHLLCARPRWAGTVLADLATTGHATGLLRRWTAPDVDRLWAALGFDDVPVATDPTSLAAAGDALAATPRPVAAGVDDLARHRLAGWLTLTRRHPDRAGRAPVAALLARLIDLQGLLRAEPDLGPLLAMGSGLPPHVASRIGAGPLADRLTWLPPLTARHPEAAARMADAVVDLHPPLSSPVGGVALCIPAIVDLGLWPLWRREVDEPTARRYLFALLLQALGRRRAVPALGDEMVAALAGLDRPPVADGRLPVAPDAGPPAWATHLPDPDLGPPRDAGQPRDAAGGPRLGPIGWPWLSPSLDASLATSATVVLRRTARRLPRPGGADAARLLGLCLAQPATLHTEPTVLSVVVHGVVAAALLGTAELPDALGVPWLDRPLRLAVSSREPAGGPA